MNKREKLEFELHTVPSSEDQCAEGVGETVIASVGGHVIRTVAQKKFGIV